MTLTLQGNGTLNGLTVLGAPVTTLANTGTAASPSLVFDGDSDTGLFRPGANQLGLSVGGSARLSIASNGDTTFTNNVGIGTAAPKRHLHINGGNETVKIQLTNSTTGSSTDGEGFQIGIAADGTANLEQRENADLVFYTNNSPRMLINSSGNVGIGNVNPASYGSPKTLISGADLTLTLMGTGSTNNSSFAGIKFRVAGSSTGDYTKAGIFSRREGGYNDLSLIFALNTTADASSVSIADEKMRISSNGNVGVGDINPDARCVVYRQTQFASNNVFAVKSDAGSTKSTKFMVDGDGKIGIGTDSPSQLLHLEDTSAFIALTDSADSGDAGILFRNTAGSNRGTITYSFTDDVIKFRASTNGAGESMRILSGGGITFNGDTAAANALDDYEEGTWTPQARDNFSGGNQGSFSFQEGFYTKIGNQVNIWGRFSNVDTTGMIGSYDMCIAGLPFTNAAHTNVAGQCSVVNTTFNTSAIVGLRLEGARSSFRFLESQSGSTVDFLTVSQFTSGSADAFFHMVYFV